MAWEEVSAGTAGKRYFRGGQQHGFYSNAKLKSVSVITLASLNGQFRVNQELVRLLNLMLRFLGSFSWRILLRYPCWCVDFGPQREEHYAPARFF